ncbi:MAG: GAF domain-containing sensor histidine kinase [Gemmatimonadaceae bacterium]
MESRERLPEGEALRLLARQMAAVADSGELLAILCDAAESQCGGSGAAVVKADGDTGDIVSTSGILKPGQGRRFTLRGSLLLEMQKSHDVVGVADVQASARPITKAVPEVAIGPMLIAPLMAHNSLIGGLAVAREPGAAPFSGTERERLRLIADHAALALWKADLLEQARAADAAKGRFLATISHELRTPLTALTGYEELLVDEVLGPISDPQRDVLERMRSVTHHLTAMIEDVLAYSSLEMGHETVRPTEFLLVDLIRAVAAVAEPLARQKSLTFDVDLPSPTVRVTTDIDRARQILINLAANAVKFTEKGGVRMTAIPGANHVRIAVMDSGIGIPQAVQRQLFKPFAQVDTGLTRRHGGTGLGLYISAQLAKLLGGRIELESAAGQGATFTLVLPKR